VFPKLPLKLGNALGRLALLLGCSDAAAPVPAWRCTVRSCSAAWRCCYCLALLLRRLAPPLGKLPPELLHLGSLRLRVRRRHPRAGALGAIKQSSELIDHLKEEKER
jgi:hypothetical protein